MVLRVHLFDRRYIFQELSSRLIIVIFMCHLTIYVGLRHGKKVITISSSYLFYETTRNALHVCKIDILSILVGSLMYASTFAYLVSKLRKCASMIIFLIVVYYQ